MKSADHLTVIDPDLERKRERTPAGMAFWAGTGPVGKTCRECVHYVFSGYTSSKSANGGVLKKGPCQKFINLTNIRSNKIPFDTESCKYFEQNPKPPTISDQGN